MRIAHVADLHFGRRMTPIVKNGVNVRETDIYQSGLEVAKYLSHVTPKLDLVVIAGDIFDTVSPTPRAVQGAFDFLATLQAAELPILIVAGNHETLSKTEQHSMLHVLSQDEEGEAIFKNITVVTGFEEGEEFEQAIPHVELQLKSGKVNAYCLPYRVLSNGEYDISLFDVDQNELNIFVAHANIAPTPVEGIKPMPDFSQHDKTIVPRDFYENSDIALTMLGHIHIHGQVFPGTFYSGAIERLRWDEIHNTPSFFIHEIEDKPFDEAKNIQVGAFYIEEYIGEEYPASQVFYTHNNPNFWARSYSVPIENLENSNWALRKAYHLELDCDKVLAKDTLQYIEDNIKNFSQDHNLEQALLQLTLHNTDYDTRSVPMFEASIDKLLKSKGVFAIKLRNMLKASPEMMLMDIKNPASGSTLSDLFFDWAKDNGWEDVASRGAELIGGGSV